MTHRKYSSCDFIWIPLRYSPVQTLFTIIYTLADALLPAYQTIVTAKFINTVLDVFQEKKDAREILWPIVLIVLYILFYNLMPALSSIIELSGKNRITVAIRTSLLQKRSRLEYCHVENAETQDLIDRVCKEPEESFHKGFHALLGAAKLIISSVSLLCIIMTSSPIAGVLITAVSIPLFYMASRIGKQNYEMSKETQRIKRTYNYLSDVLTVREYAAERSLFRFGVALRQKYKKLYEDAFQVERKIQIKTYANMKSGSMLTIVLIAIIIASLLPALAQGDISIGMFIALTNAVMSLVQSMSWRLSEAMWEYSRMREYLKDLNLFFALSEKKDALTEAKLSGKFEFESLEFRNVTFRYPGTEHDILKNCSFRLEQGKSYALVGVNGAGKSTITKLITGMYDQYEGEILLNGDDIRKYEYAEIKALISVVFQDYTRYQMSVKENMLLGKQTQPDESRMRTVMDQIGLSSLISRLRLGLDTPLGKLEEDGVDLSGGEWQRIAIARMLYNAVPINILDEPTAALDPVAESKVYELFGKLNRERFNLYITHRLGAARIMDEILVLDDGQIIEQGCHERLMQIENGLYRKMFESQSEWYQ